MQKKGEERMKPLVKKINQILKENEPITDFISKIVLAVITISIAVTANHLSKQQTKIEEINVIPNIYMESEKNEYGWDEVKVYNNGGPVYHLKATDYSMLHVDILGEEETIKIPIQLHVKRETGNQSGLLLAYPEYVHLEEKELEKKLQERLAQDKIEKKIMISTNTCIKITYTDKLNQSETKYLFDGHVLEENQGRQKEKIYQSDVPIRFDGACFDKIYQVIYDKITQKKVRHFQNGWMKIK